MGQTVGQLTLNFNANVNFEIVERLRNKTLYKGTIYGLNKELKEKNVYLVFPGGNKDSAVEITIVVF